MARINEFLDMKTDIVNTNHENYPIKGDIEFRNVSYVYPNTGIKALDNLSFKIEAGKSLAIMGKTGSGKSHRDSGNYYAGWRKNSRSGTGSFARPA